MTGSRDICVNCVIFAYKSCSMLTLIPPNPWRRRVSGVRWGTDPLTEYMKQPGVSITRLSFLVASLSARGDEEEETDEVMTTVPLRAADSCVDWRMMLNVRGDILQVSNLCC